MADWNESVSRIKDLLRCEFPVLLIDNVADYFYRSDQTVWTTDHDFPNIAPPFPQFWCEHKMPQNLSPKGRVGLLVTTIEPGFIEGTGEPPAGTKWLLWCEIFLDFAVPGIAAQYPNLSILLAVDEHGTLLKNKVYSYDDDGESLAQTYTFWLDPTLLTLSFLHCRNVAIVDNPVPPKLAKKYRERHGGRQPVAFKTLVIEPLKKVLKSAGAEQKGVGLAQAMHICRGHFKDYREGRGLFGKYHQIVWQPMLVRGTEKRELKREIEVKI
jgi:hypothetical protein